MEYGIEVRIVLVGSGTSNMVTRNGKGRFDLDYNLVLSSIPSIIFKKERRAGKKYAPALRNVSFLTYAFHNAPFSGSAAHAG